ncbi:MAG TPA: type II toxin-antitoxin system VapC family toxin [Burkholderiales bacterium]|nr:type II toxin-antitoxin system VapC family toxin [Burkholderiales bacterium]
MRILLDTHIALWVVGPEGKLKGDARSLILDATNDVYFSAASIWEIAIKGALRRRNFAADPQRVSQALLASGFLELSITAAHASRVAALPPVHQDPFDRMLVAQSQVEPMTFLTLDALLARYGSTVKVV